MTLAAIPGAKLAGSLTAEHGPRPAMLAGFAVPGAALLAMTAIGVDTPYLPIALLFALAGCRQGLAIPATMAAALEIVRRQRSGVGAATVNAARQTGTVLGVDHPWHHPRQPHRIRHPARFLGRLRQWPTARLPHRRPHRSRERRPARDNAHNPPRTHPDQPADQTGARALAGNRAQPSG